MLLIGRNLSPFVRRVAITLNLLGFRYGQEHLSALKEGDAVRQYNPVGRVPVLVLDNGERLVDSNSILDCLHIMAGDTRLLPADPDRRRTVMQVVGMATSVMEKTVAAAYERSQRPADFVYGPWRDRVDRQVRDGLELLGDALGDGTFFVGEEMTRADIDAVVAHDFAKIAIRGLVGPECCPGLARLSGRLNRTDAFRWADPAFPGPQG